MYEMRVLHASSQETVNHRLSRREPAAGRRRSGGYLLDMLFAAGTVFIVLLVLWARSGVEATVAARAGDLTARAVLRDDMTEIQARGLAEELEHEEPGLQVLIIGPEEARSRLALQESWMRHLPEVELPELPTILQIRHPRMLTDATEVAAFHFRLESRPEVQFVQFNSLGHESLVRFATQVRSISNGIAGTVAVVMASLLLIFAMVRRRQASLVLSLLATIVGAGAGAGLLLGAARVLDPAATIPALPTMLMASAVAIATGVRVIGSLLNPANRTRNDR